MNCAAIIVGIDGWEKYTAPLAWSLEKEAKCPFAIVDNSSEIPYQTSDFGIRTRRLCYSAAINAGKKAIDTRFFPVLPDWYIVLSNDVLCTGPFAHLLARQDGEAVVGPLLKSVHGFEYIEGWCMAISRRVWDTIGGFDENYQGSDYEDVDYSTMARESGFWLEEVKELPFVHLDQRQRYHVVPDFAGKDDANREYFLRKHARVTA